MTEPTQRNIPALPPLPTTDLAPIANLAVELAAKPSSELLAKVSWDGPQLDPQTLAARAMLAWLR